MAQDEVEQMAETRKVDKSKIIPISISCTKQ
jgi:hypothetical protein